MPVMIDLIKIVSGFMHKVSDVNNLKPFSENKY